MKQRKLAQLDESKLGLTKKVSGEICDVFAQDRNDNFQLKNDRAAKFKSEKKSETLKWLVSEMPRWTINVK